MQMAGFQGFCGDFFWCALILDQQSKGAGKRDRGEGRDGCWLKKFKLDVLTIKSSQNRPISHHKDKEESSYSESMAAVPGHGHAIGALHRCHSHNTAFQAG